MQSITLVLILLLALIVFISSYRLPSLKSSSLLSSSSSNRKYSTVLFDINKIDDNNKIENLDSSNDHDVSAEPNNNNNNSNRFDINNIIKKFKKTIVSTALMASSLNVPLLRQRRNILTSSR